MTERTGGIASAGESSQIRSSASRPVPLTLVLLAALFVMPPVFGWLFFLNPQWLPDRHNNAGELIHPAPSLLGLDLRGAEGQPLTASPFGDAWRMAVVADGVCRERCGLQLQSLEAIRRATGGNQQRIRPLLLVLPGSGERQSQAGELAVERVWVSKASLDELSRMIGLPDRDLNDYSFVIDPMGALMMAHNHQLLESKQILGDMEKLLKVSQNWVKGTSYGHN